jgi:hypothetical protein
MAIRLTVKQLKTIVKEVTSDDVQMDHMAAEQLLADVLAGVSSLNDATGNANYDLQSAEETLRDRLGCDPDTGAADEIDNLRDVMPVYDKAMADLEDATQIYRSGHDKSKLLDLKSVYRALKAAGVNLVDEVEQHFMALGREPENMS